MVREVGEGTPAGGQPKLWPLCSLVGKAARRRRERNNEQASSELARHDQEHPAIARRVRIVDGGGETWKGKKGLAYLNGTIHAGSDSVDQRTSTEDGRVLLNAQPERASLYEVASELLQFDFHTNMVGVRQPRGYDNV